MTDHHQTTPLPPVALLKAARRLLRPLVRLMIRSGVTFPVLSDTIRCLFVDVAVQDFLTDPKARTDSRISILTGVHRKEIRRLRSTPSDGTGAPDAVSISSQIIARWLGTAPFADRQGKPLALPRSAGDAQSFGDTPSFEALVASVTTDVRPRAILDNLISHGAVIIDSDDRVHLNAEAFIPRPGGEEQLFYFSRNLHDHITAAVANVSAASQAPYLDRSVHYDRLSQDQADALRVYARDAGMRVLLDVNRRASELTEGQPETTGDRRRVNFGIYILDDSDTDGGDS